MRDKSFNILLIASWYPSKDHPTTGSFVQEQAQMLRDFGHQVIVIHPFMHGTFLNSISKRPYISFTLEDGIQVLRVGVAPPMPFFRGISYAYCFYWVQKAMKKFHIDVKQFNVIHSHAMFMGGVIGYYLSNKHKVPQVHTEHTSGLIFNRKQYTKNDMRITKKTYMQCHKVLFVSGFALKHIIAYFDLKSMDTFVVLPNMVDDAFFLTPLHTHTKDDPFKFLVIGNFIPIKNHHLLLDAFKLAQKEIPTVALTIAGNGPLEKELRAICEFQKLKNVTWLPRLNRTEVKQQMAAHQAILSTSRLETFGLTIAEAQAMGKPVVVTDSGGVQDIVTVDTGIITESNSEAFSSGLLKLIQSYNSFDSEKIRHLTKSRFASKEIIHRLNEIYKSAS